MTLDPHAPAFPIPATERLRDAVGVLNPMYSGMTVRTYLAGLAMQGLLANPDRIDPAVFAEAARYGAKASDVIAGIAVTNADALLEALRSSTRPGDGPKAVTHLVGPEAERVTAPDAYDGLSQRAAEAKLSDRVQLIATRQKFLQPGLTKDSLLQAIDEALIDYATGGHLMTEATERAVAIARNIINPQGASE